MSNPVPLIRDVSVYDPTVNYDAYDGFMIRCFNGLIKDARFEQHRAGAMVALKPWWPYMFYDFRYPAGPQMPAALAIIDPVDGNQVMCIDVERWYIYPYPPRDTLLAGMKTLHDTYLSMTGWKPMFYINVECIHYLKPIPDWLLTCQLHIAHWGTYTPDYEPWVKWTLHQYQGEPDYNQFNGTMEEFKAWLFVGQEPPPPPVLPDKVIINVASLNIRSAPDARYSSNVVGSTKYNSVWNPIGVTTGPDLDGVIREWWQINKYEYIARWLTR